MKPVFENIALHDHKDLRRFEMTVNNHLSLIEYEIRSNIIALLHTEVDPALEGQGVGTAIVEKTLHHVEEQGMKILPLCPFVSAYIKRHPEWNRIVHSS